MKIHLIIKHIKHEGMDYPEKAFLDIKQAGKYCSAQNQELIRNGKYAYDGNNGTDWYETFTLEVEEVE